MYNLANAQRPIRRDRSNLRVSPMFGWNKIGRAAELHNQIAEIILHLPEKAMMAGQFDGVEGYFDKLLDFDGQFRARPLAGLRVKLDNANETRCSFINLAYEYFIW